MEVLDQEFQQVVVDSICHSARMCYSAMAEDAGAPHVRMRPDIYPDGDHWCALYGEDLQNGIAGFGKSPELACRDFDTNWFKQMPSPLARGEE